ncbi:GTP-binding protein, partial [Candidatus Bipolaricaulota bacterium]|nr:GTP-binding protein [Candidatus Bipolaricaulota bacterium]
MANSKSLSLIGHSGTGKSELAKNFLQMSGVDGDVTFDPSPEEKEHGHSIDLGIGSFKYKGQNWTVLDTPGADEFVEEVYKGVFVSETSLLFVDAEKGIQAHTKKLWEVAQGYDKPTALLFNGMDKDEANFDEVLGEVREALNKNIVVLEIPILEDGEFVGFVEVASGKAKYFDGETGEVPDELQGRLEEEREKLLEALAEQDDELMMKYLEEEEITAEDTEVALNKGFAANEFSPVFVGSVVEGLGTDLLLTELNDLVPEFDPGEGRGRSDALVFNQFSDPYLGRLSFVKVYGEELREDATLRDLQTGDEHDITDIYRYHGGDQEKTHEAKRGDVVALGKLEEVGLS